MSGDTGQPLLVVDIGQGANADIRSIAIYLADHASIDVAQDFLTEILDRIATLASFPLRGSKPAELSGTGREQYRQILHGRYRIIYRVEDDAVTVVLVADGRRDMQALLRDRLLGGSPS